MQHLLAGKLRPMGGWGGLGRSVIQEAINDVTTTHHSKISVMWWSVCGLVDMGVEEVSRSAS